MRIGEATKDDVRTVALNMRESDYREFAALNFAETREALADELSGRPWNVLVGALDAPICIGDALPSRPGVVSLLFYATDRFPEIALPMTRWIKKTLFPTLRKAGVHRIEAISAASHNDAHRWIHLLGLTKEAELKGYGGNRETFFMFAWVDPCLSD